jgi:hypothetical protein
MVLLGILFFQMREGEKNQIIHLLTEYRLTDLDVWVIAVQDWGFP